ncbi:SH3 domain-containing protein [Streptomyces sp. NPDC088846]|uniref:SH3 domain-containing protein n=1 Tax=Streptomyces sp. NPDC088846 TaxID=3365908 RepID=UPI003811931E
MQKPTIALLAATAVLGMAIPATAVAAPTAASTAVAGNFNPCGYYPTTTIMLRTGPSQKRTAIGQLSAGDAVSAFKASGAWYKVSLSFDTPNGLRAGTEGWVAKKHLKAATCMQLD